MKAKNIISALLIIMSLVACSPAIKIPSREDNFAFVFEETPCGTIPMNILDSASETLTHTPIGDSHSVTISLSLTDDELESIYQKAISIGFFDYPSEFIIPNEQVIGYHSPASTYKLSLTNGEMTNSVTWHDDTMTKPSYAEADQLRELMNLIEEIIQSHPEIKQLPEPKAGCA
jgi:hypothetical protein